MKILRNYFYNVGYQILNMILPLITGPYVARVLGPSGVGINTYTGAVIQYFVLFGGLGIALYGNRQIAYVRNDSHKLSVTFWEIQSIKIVTVSIAFIFFLIYLAFVHEYRVYLILQSMYIVATGFDISWLYEGVEDFKKTFTRNTLVRLISLILILLLVRSKNDVWLYIFILAISNLGGYMALWPTLKTLVSKVSIKEIHPLKHLNGIIGLFIPFMALNIYPAINKTLLKAFVGIDSSGYYEKSDVMIRMVLTLVTAISAVLLPHTSQAYSENKINLIKELLKKSFSYVSMLSFPIAFGMAAVAPKFGLFFYGPGFGPVGVAMFIESFAIIFMGWSSTTGNQYLIPTRQNKHYSYSVLLGSVLNIILDIPFIYLFRLNGASLATVISEGIIAGYQLFVIGKQVNMRGWIKDIFKYLLASVVLFGVVFVISNWLTMTILHLFVEILIGIVLYGVSLVILKPSTLEQTVTTIRHVLIKK
ncbi:oligosaccharide flippase family protein [Heyndrickxia oleronia]|uniref:oligosaccharide flippase family protein n=1 Tax=Heyndrickxia oleronia TaxID=38875 RepID=UPI00242B6B25|nr:polysaccharide biosynthesis C-terminal domain-containing protein [Heyndrickxia oleronia]MCI1593405.1 polysaccharide biosynthesis C-terminal domain-containing protein [Heyndrickxia oleronia]MCI1746499.1 polysaccharide biosynthesis C-terminal domain-containing protein [Heyndrickxia oleronia]MCI1764298.1 polysaccharide biosynthesis C-terminal domain-containing protein [Heyndrickxia oleronia]